MKKILLFSFLGILLLTGVFLHLFRLRLTDSEPDIAVTLQDSSTDSAEYLSSATDFVTSQLDEILSNLDIQTDNLTASQLLVVMPKGSNATVYCYEKSGNCWDMQRSAITGYVGKNGVSENKSEGDGATPVGYYPLLYAFGIEEPLEIHMTYRQIDANSYWVDDPDSLFYNQWVEGIAQQDWKSAEHLIDYTSQYALGVVIGYNTDPVVPGLGSAIFLHCGDHPTAGCIAVSRDAMAQILNWLDEDMQPAIVICKNTPD